MNNKSAPETACCRARGSRIPSFAWPSVKSITARVRFFNNYTRFDNLVEDDYYGGDATEFMDG